MFHSGPLMLNYTVNTKDNEEIITMLLKATTPPLMVKT